ncbi:MAG: hypothetical protein M3133_08955, partial [Actinomycetota bacterium]|nr:hypothetical protein [Actinomycetota bacterium]
MSSELRDAAASRPRWVRARRYAWVLFAAAAWNAYVWLTRLGLVLDGRNTVPFRVVHGVLIVVSLAFATALAFIGWRLRREANEELRDGTSGGGAARVAPWRRGRGAPRGPGRVEA